MRSKACTVFSFSKSGILGSNPAIGISLFYFKFVGVSSATDRSVVYEVLLNICKQYLETRKKLAVVCSSLNTQYTIRLIGY